jgi:hypothetical protein
VIEDDPVRDLGNLDLNLEIARFPYSRTGPFLFSENLHGECDSFVEAVSRYFRVMLNPIEVCEADEASSEVCHTASLSFYSSFVRYALVSGGVPLKSFLFQRRIERHAFAASGSAGSGLAFALKFIELGNEVIVTGRRRSTLE